MGDIMGFKQEINLEKNWLKYLAAEFEQPYMKHLQGFLLDQKEQGKLIYPPWDLTFSAFNATPLKNVRVVILGQDPYHSEGQAHGLSFSVPKGVKPPPSLMNIFKEIQRDLHIPIPPHGCLDSWAEQGVLLLNASLSVAAGEAGSHQKQGWEVFTDKVISLLNDECEGLVFMLWGAYAQKKGQCINGNKHLVLKAVHPSPLSAYRGFLGCNHFSQTNEYLINKGEAAMNWHL